MSAFFEILQESGPFTMPLCAGLVYALVWMKKQVDKQETRAVAAEKDARQLRDQRTEELLEATKAMGQFGEAMANRIREHDTRIDRVIRQLGGDR